jgi:hypothetical protein
MSDYFAQAYRTLHVTYPLVKDPKLFVSALESLYLELQKQKKNETLCARIKQLLDMHSQAQVVLRKEESLILWDSEVTKLTYPLMLELLEEVKKTHDLP